ASCTTYAPHRDLLSFPTRRSSDLDDVRRLIRRNAEAPKRRRHQKQPDGMLAEIAGEFRVGPQAPPFRRDPLRDGLRAQFRRQLRSEEHTSELQSRFDLVCRLLLEK